MAAALVFWLHSCFWYLFRLRAADIFQNFDGTALPQGFAARADVWQPVQQLLEAVARFQGGRFVQSLAQGQFRKFA
jgi:hypothetical protein